jgi:hypothetical protein
LVRLAYEMFVNTKACMTAWLENKTSRSDTREAEKKRLAILKCKVPAKI